MLKRSSKKFALMLVLTMLATMFVGVGTASAAGVEVHVNKIVSVDKDSATKEDPAFLGDVQIMEDGDFPADFEDDDTFVLTLPSGVKWLDTTIVKINDEIVTPTFSGSYTLNVTIKNTDKDVKDTITVKPVVYFDGFSGGDVILNIDGLDSAVPSGEYLIAKGEGGGTETRVLNTATIGEGNEQKGAVVRITETAQDSLGSEVISKIDGQEYTEKITLTLPTDFAWNAKTEVNALGAFKNAHIVKTKIRDDDKKIDIYFDRNNATKGTGRGIIEVTPYINVDSKASIGDVELDVEGINDIDDATVIIATYADFDVTVEAADSTVEEVVSGQTEQELTKIIIKENVKGSLIANRNIEIELPSGVKFSNNSNAVSKTLKAGSDIFDKIEISDYDLVKIPIKGTSDSKAKLEVKLKKVNIEPDFTGDIVVKIKGRAGVEGEVVVGKVLPALTGKTDKVDLKIGYKAQEIKDIVLTEGKKGALVDDATLILEAPNGVTFNGTPTVKVTNGNLDIKDSDIKVTDNKSNLKIEINSESNRASEITISNVKLDIDRTVPEGTIALTVKGKAVAESCKDYFGINDEDKYGFSSDEAGDIIVANCITPAPGGVVSSASFVIGSTTYTVNGVENTMDVAPYIKDARTYMPIRYIANAMGIDDNNILWDAASQTVTLIKGDKVVQLKIGSTTIVINGAPITMDVAPEITNSRTMLPARFVAQAFGANVGWDAATQTVTID